VRSANLLVGYRETIDDWAAARGERAGFEAVGVPRADVIVVIHVSSCVAGTLSRVKKQMREDGRNCGLFLTSLVR